MSVSKCRDRKITEYGELKMIEHGELVKNNHYEQAISREMSKYVEGDVKIWRRMCEKLV